MVERDLGHLIIVVQKAIEMRLGHILQAILVLGLLKGVALFVEL
jgi:hypothetical protein